MRESAGSFLKYRRISYEVDGRFVPDKNNKSKGSGSVDGSYRSILLEGLKHKIFWCFLLWKMFWMYPLGDCDEMDFEV